MAVRKSRRWAILALAAGLLLSVAWIGSAFLRARGALEEHRRDSDRILDEFPAEACARPAILDPEEPGNAWEPELRALAAANGRGDPEAGSHRFNRYVGIGGAELPEVGKLASGRAGADEWVGLLRRALRMSEVAPRKHPGVNLCEMGRRAVEILLEDVLVLHHEGRDVDALERVVLAIGLAQDLARHGDREHLGVLWMAEQQGVLNARAVLSSHALGARELEGLARALDRLAAVRPGLGGILRRDAALSRRYVIREFADMFLYTESSGPELRPTWRDLGSETLHKARRVAALKRLGAAFGDIERFPPWRRRAEADRIQASLDLECCQWEERLGEPLFADDAVVLLHRTLLRVAVALAWREAERGVLPGKLEELAPRYLPGMPACSVTGESLRYEAGRLWASVPRSPGPETSLYEATAPERFEWCVARKAR